MRIRCVEEKISDLVFANGRFGIREASDPRGRIEEMAELVRPQHLVGPQLLDADASVAIRFRNKNS